MVNMEAWIPPQIDLVHRLDSDGLMDLGFVAPPGYFSWFVPRSLSRQGETWATFAKPETAARFSVDEDILSIIKNHTVDQRTDSHFCNETYCLQGMYIPEQCQSQQTCALLLTSHPDVTEFVKTDIDAMKLYVKVAWVGHNLKQLTETLTTKYSERANKSMTPADNRYWNTF